MISTKSYKTKANVQAFKCDNWPLEHQYQNKTLKLEDTGASDRCDFRGLE